MRNSNRRHALTTEPNFEPYFLTEVLKLRSLRLCLLLLASLQMLSAPQSYAAVFNALDYGAIANDGQSDFYASRSAIEAAASLYIRSLETGEIRITYRNRRRQPSAHRHC